MHLYSKIKEFQNTPEHSRDFPLFIKYIHVYMHMDTVFDFQEILMQLNIL